MLCVSAVLCVTYRCLLAMPLHLSDFRREAMSQLEGLLAEDFKVRVSTFQGFGRSLCQVVPYAVCTVCCVYRREAISQLNYLLLPPPVFLGLW